MELRRLSTTDYITDNPFDKIDVKEQIEKNKNLQKCNKEFFLFNLLSHDKLNINEKFGLDLEDIKNIEYENDIGRIVTLKDEFKINKVVGKGSYGIVLDVYDKKFNINLALKIIRKTTNSINEVTNHMKIRNKNIVEFYRFFDNFDYVFILMELMTGGTLRDLIITRYNSKGDYLTEEEASVIMRGVLNGIDYLHGKNMSHRDIKPENIMFKEKNNLESVKLLDLGLVIEFEEYYDKTRCGTLLYMAPEQLAGKDYSKTVDIWAAGIILYILCSGGKHPSYLRKMDTEHYIKLMTTFNKWEFPDEFPKLARNLFFKMCKIDKNQRIDSYKIKYHPWLTRDKKAPIPLTNHESWQIRKEINQLKVSMMTFIFLSQFKNNLTIKKKEVKSLSSSNSLKTEKKDIKVTSKLSINSKDKKNHLNSDSFFLKTANSSSSKFFNGSSKNLTKQGKNNSAKTMVTITHLKIDSGIKSSIKK